jgi:hypothetical protein
MGEAGAAPPLSSQDYEAIEAAVQETSRGRWFLSEYARRNRQADTLQLLDAIARLDKTVRDTAASAPAAAGLDPVLRNLARRVHRTREEVTAGLAPGEARPEPGSESLDVIAANALRANNDILRAAERVQEIAWTLRETGTDGAVCEDLDRQATEIYAACTSHELTIGRVRSLVDALRAIEQRVANRLAEGAGAADALDEMVPFAGEALIATIDDSPPMLRERPASLVLDDDIVMVEAKPYMAEAGPEPDSEFEPDFEPDSEPETFWQEPAQTAAMASTSFSAIDQMPLHDRLSRFT